MIVAGSAILMLGLYVVFRFREQNFVPATSKRWAASWSIFKRGVFLAQRSRAILVIFLATFLVNGAGEAGRLFQKRLVDIGLPTNPVIWFTVLGIISLLAGAVALRFVEHRIEGTPTAKRVYVLACTIGALGFIIIAAVPEEIIASAAILLYAGLAVPLMRTLSTIWVNRQTTSDVRATVHSFLAQAEYLGEVLIGLSVAVVARLAGLSAAIVAGAALLALTVMLVLRFTTSRTAGKTPVV